MAEIPIGSITPAATRVEPADVTVGNVVEHGGDTRDISIEALRRSNADHDIESILNAVNIVTAGVKRLTALNTGEIGVNNLAPVKDFDVIGEIRASVGILFGADTAPANTLDDYEEGAWTPQVEGATISGTYTITVISANYIKIGRKVSLSAQITFSAASGGTGRIRIFGLPFNYGSIQLAIGTLSPTDLNLTTAIPAALSIQSEAGGPADTLLIAEIIDNSAQVFTLITGITTSTRLDFNLEYLTD